MTSGFNPHNPDHWAITVTVPASVIRRLGTSAEYNEEIYYIIREDDNDLVVLGRIPLSQRSLTKLH